MMRAKKCDRCGKFYDHYARKSRFGGGCKVSDLLLPASCVAKMDGGDNNAAD